MLSRSDAVHSAACRVQSTAQRDDGVRRADADNDCDSDAHGAKPACLASSSSLGARVSPSPGGAERQLHGEGDETSPRSDARLSP